MTTTPTLCPCCGNTLQVRWPFIYKSNLHFGEDVIRLAPMEVRMLQLLLAGARLQRPFIPTEELFEVGWGTGHGPVATAKTAVASRILTFRRKIAHLSIHIVARRGYGYYLALPTLVGTPNDLAPPGTPNSNRLDNAHDFSGVPPEVLPRIRPRAEANPNINPPPRGRRNRRSS